MKVHIVENFLILYELKLDDLIFSCAQQYSRQHPKRFGSKHTSRATVLTEKYPAHVLAAGQASLKRKRFIIPMSMHKRTICLGKYSKDAK